MFITGFTIGFCLGVAAMVVMAVCLAVLSVMADGRKQKEAGGLR